MFGPSKVLLYQSPPSWLHLKSKLLKPWSSCEGLPGPAPPPSPPAAATLEGGHQGGVRTMLGPRGGAGVLLLAAEGGGGNGERGMDPTGCPWGGAHLESHQGGRAPAECQRGGWDEGTKGC